MPGVVLLIPWFLILQQQDLYDTNGGMIIPLLSTAASAFIMKQFFDSSPELNTFTTGVASLESGRSGSGNQFPLQLAAAVPNTTGGAEKS